jgi:hypothetical protein
MEEKIRFNTRNCLLATGILAVWCAVAFNGWDLLVGHPSRGVAGLIVYDYLLLALPPFAVGTFIGRPWFALLCGSVSAFALVIWQETHLFHD